MTKEASSDYCRQWLSLSLRPRFGASAARCCRERPQLVAAAGSNSEEASLSDVFRTCFALTSLRKLRLLHMRDGVSAEPAAPEPATAR